MEASPQTAPSSTGGEADCPHSHIWFSDRLCLTHVGGTSSSYSSGCHLTQLSLERTRAFECHEVEKSVSLYYSSWYLTLCVLKWGDSLGIHKSFGGSSNKVVIAQYKRQLVRLTGAVGTFPCQWEFVRVEWILVIHLSPGLWSRIRSYKGWMIFIYKSWDRGEMEKSPTIVILTWLERRRWRRRSKNTKSNAVRGEDIRRRRQRLYRGSAGTNKSDKIVQIFLVQ